MSPSLVLYLACSLAAWPECRGAGPLHPQLPRDVEEVLWWLPEDTETLVVYRKPTSLRSLIPLGEGLQDEGGPMEIEGLAGRLGERTVACLVEGARRFRAPHGLGLMPFEGAWVLVFEGDVEEPVARAAREVGAARETIGGRELFTLPLSFSEAGEDDVTAYVATPRPDTLVVATDRGYVVDLLRRSAARAGRRAFPEGLPEWEGLDATAPLWAIRHYAARGAEEDPSSPLGKPDRKGWYFADDQAVGLTVESDTGMQRAVVRYHSRNPEAAGLSEGYWQTGARRVGPGVTESTIPLGRGAMFLRLLTALGHGVCT